MKETLSQPDYNKYAELKKNGFMRQKQADTFSLRLRIVGGTVTTTQLAKIIEVADKYGHEYIHLTSRQSIEIPFIKLSDTDAVRSELEKGGVYPGACGARVRTVTACQGNTVCPNSCIDTLKIARELDRRYYGRDLPHKFKFGVTGCHNNCLKADENDLGIKGGFKVRWVEEKCISCGLCEKACRRCNAISIENGKVIINRGKCNNCGRCAFGCPVDAFDVTPGYMISVGGLFGNTISRGKGIVPFTDSEEKLFEVCDIVIQFFEDHAETGERLKFALDRVGTDILKKEIREALRKKRKK